MAKDIILKLDLEKMYMKCIYTSEFTTEALHKFHFEIKENITSTI